MLIQLFSSILVYSSSENIHLHASHVGKLSATIYLDFREKLLIVIVTKTIIIIKKVIQLFKTHYTKCPKMKTRARAKRHVICDRYLRRKLGGIVPCSTKHLICF